MSTLILILKHPLAVIFAIISGLVFGQYFPQLSISLEFLSSVYINLLKVVTLPLMISAVIFSISRLFGDGNAKQLLARFLLVFSIFLPLTIAITLIVGLLFQPGGGSGSENQNSLGLLVEETSSEPIESMKLFGNNIEEATLSFAEILLDIVPSNIFSAMAEGKALSVLIFALFFGSALGSVSATLKGTLTSAVEGVYRTCLMFTSWLIVPLPLALFAAVSSQIGKTGFGPFVVMGDFLWTLLVASLVIILLSVVVLWRRSQQTFLSVIEAIQLPVSVALATRSSVASMPSMIEGLHRLKFSKFEAELLVPLSVSLARIGPTVFYIIATMFISELYGRPIEFGELILVGLACFLAGMASAGASGIVALSMVSIACGFLGLPFEAALILFIAVDVISDVLRTVLLVVGNMAISALVCPKKHQKTEMTINDI